jgi:hypothetical protein
MRSPIPFAKAESRFDKANWKTKRRIMRSFKLSEISGVDVPAQEGAVFLFSKRADLAPAAPDTSTPEGFVKVAFQEAWDEKLLDRRFYEAFGAAFDDLWQAQDAFRTALRDKYNNGEEQARQFVAVVADMAARAVAATDGFSKGQDPDKSSVSKALADAVKQAADVAPKEDKMFKTLADLKDAIAKHTAGDAVSAAVIKAAAAVIPGGLAELPTTGELAAVATEDAATKALKRENAILKMAPAVRKHFDALGADQQDAFLAKDAAGQQAEVEAANAEDPVVYTTKSGREIRKSAGALVEQLARDNDELRGDIATLKSAGEQDSFAKAAAAYPNLPTAGTIATLKAAASLDATDKAAADAMRATLKAGNDAAATKFRRIGSGVAKSVEGNGENVEAQLDALATKHAADNNVPFAKAYDAVIQTAEGRDLYKRYNDEQMGVAE